MYKTINTKSILNEWRNFLNKNSLLKEEYDPSTGELILYHLTGLSKFKEYNPVVSRRNDAINNFQYNEYSGDPSDRSSSTIHRLRNQEPKEMSEAEIVSSSLKSLIDYPFTDGTGFTPGKGAMYGPALYTCYEFNPDIVSQYGDIAIKFETNINGFLIFFEDVAKQVYGDNWEIVDQIRLLLTDKTGNDVIEQIVNEHNRKINDLSGTKMFGNSTGTSESAHDISKILFKYLTQNKIKQFVKGLIFRGNHDGPVCVVYNPKRDVNITGLGKVETYNDKKGKKQTNIIWKDNLSAFIDLYKTEDDDYIPTDDISFERMNQLQREDENYIEYFDNIININDLFDRYKELINLYKTRSKIQDYYINFNDVNEQFLFYLKKLINIKYVLNDLEMIKYFSDDINLFLLNSFNIYISDDILLHLSNNNNLKIKELVLKNTDNIEIKQKILENFYNSSDYNVAILILDNINLIQDNQLQQKILKKYSNSSDIKVISKILKNIDLIQNEELKLSFFEKYSNTNDFNINTIISSNKNCPSHILKKLFNDENPTVINNILNNPNCDIEIITYAYENTKTTYTKIAIALSPKCDIELLNIISNDIDPKVRAKVALNVNCTFELCNKIISESDLNQKKQIFRKYIGENEINQYALNILSNDPDAYIRFSVISHSQCTKQIAIKLSNDPDKKVKDIALRRLMINNLKENFNLLRSYLKLLIN